MLSIIMSGLNVAQKDLQVSANNMANANTVGAGTASTENGPVIRSLSLEMAG